MRKDSGLTLTEVLIVIGIVFLLAAVAFPRASEALERLRLSGAARIVWSDMHRAKMTAIRENRNIRVEFNTTTTYRFLRGGAGGTEVFTRNLGQDYPHASISSSGGAITFNSRGTVNGTTITVSLGGKSRSFPIASTGRIGGIK